MINKVKKILGLNSNEISLQHYQNIEGWLTPNEANGLFEISSMLPHEAVVLEIGSWKGKSTCCIAQGLKKGTINCIDPFNAAGEEGSREIYEKTKGNKSLLIQFKENLASLPSTVKIKPLQGYSNEFVGQIHNIDFLFIDGDHSIEGCRFDFDNFANEIKSGGFLAFHDYDPSRCELGPTWVIDNLVKKNVDFDFYGQFDSLWVAKKTG